MPAFINYWRHVQNREAQETFNEYVFKNMNNVLAESPEDWKKCVKKYPDLTVEITEELAKIHCSEANK